MKFLTFDEVMPTFKGKNVAIVGSGPGSLLNETGFVDSHDIVVRVNNYKTGPQQGFRCDVHFSFYGNSIRKPSHDLKIDGVKLCMCKCPNSRPIECEWHIHMGKLEGIDFRYIYDLRKEFWFCDTFIPQDDHFLKTFNLLGKHIPTTGFSAIIDVLACQPKSVYLTGFDFFSSGIHNVNERWKPGNPSDPIRHSPEEESAWIRSHAAAYPLSFDQALIATLWGTP